MLVQGDVAALAAILPRLEFLCLSKNLLGSWAHVHPIISGIQSLKVLDLSNNHLQHSDAFASFPACSFIEVLVLNDCHLKWQDAVRVGKQLSKLHELYLSNNLISALECDQDVGGLGSLFPELRILDLMDNAIRGWETVMPLTMLPALTELKLSGNPLGTIAITGTVLRSMCFLHMSAVAAQAWLQG